MVSPKGIADMSLYEKINWQILKIFFHIPFGLQLLQVITVIYMTCITGEHDNY